MRVLAKAGYKRGDIARFLGTSYQFVRNVLVKEEAQDAKSNAAVDDGSATVATSLRPKKVQVRPDGRIIVPAAFSQALGVKEGENLIAEIVEGELHLLPIPAAVRKAQAIVRQFVPEGISLVDELLEDRRREVEREERNG